MKHLKRLARRSNHGITVDDRCWNQGRYATNFTLQLVFEVNRQRAMENVLLGFFREVQVRYNLKDQILNFSRTVGNMQCKLRAGLNVKRGQMSIITSEWKKMWDL